MSILSSGAMLIGLTGEKETIPSQGNYGSLTGRLFRPVRLLTNKKVIAYAFFILAFATNPSLPM